MRRTQKAAREIIATWQQRLKLDAWEVRIDFSEPCDEDANASIWISDDYQRATIRLGEGWERAPAEQFERTMVHELVHIVLHDIRLAQKAVLWNGLLTRAVEEQVEDRNNHTLERAVENLTVILLAAFNQA